MLQLQERLDKVSRNRLSIYVFLGVFYFTLANLMWLMHYLNNGWPKKPRDIFYDSYWSYWTFLEPILLLAVFVFIAILLWKGRKVNLFLKIVIFFLPLGLFLYDYMNGIVHCRFVRDGRIETLNLTWFIFQKF